MSNIKKIIIAGGIVVLFVVFTSFQTQFVLADDDGDDEEEEENFKVIDTTPSEEATQKTEYKTITTKLSDTVTKTAMTETKYDSDGDGVYDQDDAYPTINDYFIVKDDNLNGIDDKYEQL